MILVILKASSSVGTIIFYLQIVHTKMVIQVFQHCLRMGGSEAIGSSEN